ncbi:MAG: ribonuclease P protein component [bacterium]|nr:ribonuclease P protein component [bacterium]
MLPRVNRLNKDSEIKDLAKQGKSFFLPEFIIKYYQNKENISKFAFVVSTKVDKRAVVRNRLTRRLRETIRAFLPKISPGYSVLVIAKKQALLLDFPQIKKQMAFALSKIKIYN